MKKIFVFISVAALTFMMAGCSKDKDIDMDFRDGKGLEFVHFVGSSDSWVVKESDASYNYDVEVGSTYLHDSDVTYNISVGEGSTGTEGKEFTLPSKTVTVKKGEYVGDFGVKINYDAIEGEAAKGFTIVLNLDVDDALINPSYGKTMTITVNSDKVTIDWEWLAGNWNAQDYSYYSGKNDGDSYAVSISKIDDETCKITNIRGAGGSFEAKVDFEAKTITIPGYQKMMHYDYYECDLMFIAVDPDNDFDFYYDEDGEPALETPVVAKLSPTGIVIDNWDAYMSGGDYDGYTFNGGEKTTLTK